MLLALEETDVTVEAVDAAKADEAATVGVGNSVVPEESVWICS